MTESIGTARLDIVVDTSSLDAGVTKAKRSTQDMAKTAQDASQKMDAGSKRQVAALERQIATLGKSRSEVIRWRIEQQTSGRVAAELTAKLDAQSRTMAAQAQAVAKFGDGAKRAAAAWLAFSVAAGGAALVVGIKNAIDFADRLNDINQRLGISAETLSTWAYAAQQSGTDIEALGVGLKKLAKNMTEALDSKSSQGKLFAALGVSVKDTRGNLRSLEDVLPDIATGFKSIQNETLKASLAQEVFGKSGTELVEFLNLGADGLQKMQARTRELGIELSQGTLTAADEFNDRLGDLRAASQGFATQLAAELLPALTQLTRTLTDVVRDGTAAADAADLVTTAIDGVGFALKRVDAIGDVISGLSQGFTELYGAAEAVARLDFGQAANIFRNSDADDRIVGGLRQFSTGERFKEPGSQFADVISGSSTLQGRDLQLAQARAKLQREAEDRLLGLFSEKGEKTTTKRSKASTRKRPDFAKDALEDLARLIDEETRATEAFKDFEAQLQGPMAVALRDHEKRVADLNELAAKSPEASARLSEALKLEEQRHKEVSDAIALQQQPLKLLLDDMKFELDSIGRSNAERVVMNELRRQGIDLMSQEAQAALATARAYDAEGQAKARSIELQDEFRQGVANAITDFVTGTKSATDALKDFFNEFANQVTRAIANQWVAKAFGNQGENGGGAAGDWISKAIGVIAEGWKDGGAFYNGRPVEAFANGGVFDRPTMFGMSGGRLGVMGEAGPEAIMPLERGRDGRLGVRVNDGFPARGDFNQTVNLSVQGAIDHRTQEQIAKEIGRRSSRAIARSGR